MKTLTIKISDALFAEIASEARSRNVSKSQIVRERLLRQDAIAPANKVSLWSRMEDLVIGADRLPEDLSANRARLRNYGKSAPRRSTSRWLIKETNR
jgi:hypothetical protein